MSKKQTSPKSSDSKQESGKGSSVQQLVRRVAAHLPGAGCLCAAYGESECGCSNVDWRSRREIALQTALEHCLSTLKSYHATKPGITETIRQTEMIRDAGNYRTSQLTDAQRSVQRSGQPSGLEMFLIKKDQPIHE